MLNAGVVNYDENDQFSLDGQRLINTTGNEYRFETEQWSKIIAEGSRANPTAWVQYMSDGSIRKFGATDVRRILRSMFSY